MPTEEDEEESKQEEEEEEEVKQEGVNEAEEEGKVAEGGEASAAGAGAEAGGEDDDEEELAKLIKEEDINMVPESTDVSEIDKLTGLPKNNGKYISLIFLLKFFLFFRLTIICYSHAGALHDNQLE